ncbi:MAG: glycosyltransferase involved in cell wall biosynthesis [Planctomycetota bacterium]|jgi:glycosyltransferase involved in cell wall biosynthesis
MNDRVLLCGAWDEGAGYPRTRSLRQGLEAAGIEVSECRVPGLGQKKQSLLRKPWRWPYAWWQQKEQRATLLQELEAKVAQVRPHAVVVPYPGHGLVRTIKERVAAPVAFDMFLSAYDTVVEDRQMVRPGSVIANYLQRLDTKACAAADLVVLDTPENASYVQSLTGLPADNFTWLPVHDPDAPQRATPWQAPTDGVLQLLFFGTGVPLHGLDTLITAVAQVSSVKLTLVGGSDDHRRLAKQKLGTRVMIGPSFVNSERLRELLESCHLVAGVFGESNKTQRVVPFKLVHALAAGRPVITADTPAVARWLDGSGVVFTSEAADAGALANQLRQLAANPMALAAAAGAARAAYDRHFGTPQLAARWREVLLRMNPVRFSGDHHAVTA